VRGPFALALAFALVAIALLAGCAVGPDYRRPPVTVPEQIRGQGKPAEVAPTGAEPSAPASSDVASLADRAWWEIFQDDALKALIDEALRNGYDVRLAAWRVEEARANAGIARSEFFPQIQADGGWSRSRRSGFTSPVTAPVNVYDINLGLTWEIDLWGHIRRLNQAAMAEYVATEEARRGVLLSLVSDVATSYWAWLRAPSFLNAWTCYPRSPSRIRRKSWRKRPAKLCRSSDTQTVPHLRLTASTIA